MGDVGSLCCKEAEPQVVSRPDFQGYAILQQTYEDPCSKQEHVCEHLCRDTSCSAILCDLTDAGAKVVASYSNGMVTVLEVGEDVIGAMTFECGEADAIKVMAMTPNMRLCRSNEIYGMKHLLVGTEAGIVTDWVMERSLVEPCQWQAHSRSPLASVQGSYAGISALGVACDEFITGGADGSLCLWNLSGLRQGHRHVVRKIPAAHRGAVTAVESAGPLEVFSAGEDGHVRYWSAISEAETKAGDADSALPLHMRDERGRIPPPPIISMQTDRRLNRVLVGAQDGYVRLWDTDVWRPTKRSPHHVSRENSPISQQSSLQAVSFNMAEASHHEFVSAAADGTWCLWDIRMAAPVKDHAKEGSPALISVALHGARLLTCAESSMLSLWDLRADKVLRKVMASRFLEQKACYSV
eukprot:symbB.v1.2.016953.t1/scaffold1307.1/size125927/4